MFMNARWLKQLAALAATGGGVFLFLLVAQVNLDDLRLKLGSLRPPALPDLEIGGFYTVADSGAMVGPHCLIDRATREALLEEHAGPIRVTNQLGAALPVISRWSIDLMGTLGGDDIAAFPIGRARASSSDASPQPAPAWDGHTLALDRVKREQLMATSATWRIMDASFALDPLCENNVVTRAGRGECVVVVFKVVRADTGSLGYDLADQRCFVPMVEDGDPFAPRAVPYPLSFTAWLSRMKDRLGLLEGQV